MVYACDNDDAAVRTYKRNVDDRAYTRDVTSQEFHSDIDALKSANVVLGGFPCQGFSKAGPKRSDDVRNLLYLEMKSAIEKLQPELFIAENVDGLSQNFKGAYLEQIVKDFQRLGYTVEFSILDAASFGVPQYRRRIFFVGTKDGAKSFDWPRPTHEAMNRNGESLLKHHDDLLSGASLGSLLPPRTIRDAISDLGALQSGVPDHVVVSSWSDEYKKIIKKIGEGQKLCNVRFSPTSVYTWQIPEVFGEVDETDIVILETIGKNRRHKKYGNIPNGNPLPEDTIALLSGRKHIKRRLAKLVDRGYLKIKGEGYDLKGAMFCSGLFKRPLWDAPSQTILTNYHNPRYFIHPDQNRPFSLRECARLQGFPDSFHFIQNGTDREIVDAYKLVGNAVAPPVGLLLAKSVKKYFSENKKDRNETSSKRVNDEAAIA